MMTIAKSLSLGIVLIIGCQSTPPSPGGAVRYSEGHLDFANYHGNKNCCVSQGKKIAIASGGTHSSRAGLDIYNAGGNLVDAAVATAFALAVETPQSTGLGGGGFLLMHQKKKGEDVFLDFRETAPHLATEKMYQNKKGEIIKGLSTDGVLGVATPGYVAGFYEVHSKHGKLPWSQVLAPAIRLAEEGFKIYPLLSTDIKEKSEKLLKDPMIAKIFFRKGKPLAPGELLIQKDLAKTLKLIAQNGRRGFYEGPVAKAIVGHVQKKQGILREKDLEHYSVRYREPIRVRFADLEVLSAPPPSAGGVLIAQMLGVLDHYDLKKISSQSAADYYHLLAEAMKRAYADRSEYIGDPDFVTTGYEKLMSTEHVNQLVDSINPAKATPSASLKPTAVNPTGGNHTTQMTLMNEVGDVITSTLTINTGFGSGVMVPGTGIILNNEMDDFSSKPGEANAYGLTGGKANAIAPNKRPVSSMSPTIVLRDSEAVFASGAAGGSRIITTVMQILLNDFIVFEGNLKHSVFAPRVHHQWLEDRLEVEGKGIEPAVLEALKQKGHEIVEAPYPVISQTVHRTRQGELISVSDPRDEGGAIAE